MDEYAEYWKEHWSSHSKLNNSDPQKQVARTKFGIPISQKNWIKTCEYVLNQIKPQPTDILLDLCCGNGLLTAYLVNYVDKIIAVDYSEILLDSFIVENEKITKVFADALSFKYNSYRFNKAVMYFAAQHFSERTLLLVVKKVFKSLEDGGVFLIGDIPNITKKWSYFCSAEYRKFYFSGLENGKPAVGTWYDKAFLNYLAEYIGFEKIEIIKQPGFMLNSNHRFDVLLKK